MCLGEVTCSGTKLAADLIFISSFIIDSAQHVNKGPTSRKKTTEVTNLVFYRRIKLFIETRERNLIFSYLLKIFEISLVKGTLLA